MLFHGDLQMQQPNPDSDLMHLVCFVGGQSASLLQGQLKMDLQLKYLS